MELHDVWLKKRSERVFGGIVVALLLVLAYFNWVVAGLCAILVLGVYLVTKRSELDQERVITDYLDSVAGSVTQASNYAIRNLPIGIAIVDEKSHLVWGNSVFRDWLTDMEEGERLQRLLPDRQLSKLWGKSGYFFSQVEGYYYRVVYKYLNMSDEEHADTNYMLFYFDDISEAETRKREAEEALPVFCYLQVDNFTEIASDLTEVQRSALWSEVNNCVLDEFSRLDGFIKGYSTNHYIACISRRSLEELMKSNFEVLDKVRSIHTVNRIPVTLSMGCAYGTGAFNEQAESARVALDLALGRGGDQAVVQIGDETKTFGGRAKAVAKNTRVRARVVAQAIYELIHNADRVLIMGHEREDYDALGAAIGVARMGAVLGIPAHVVVSRHQENIEKLIDLVDAQADMKGLLITAEEAIRSVTQGTILFVVDTHRPEMTAAPELIDKVKTRVVIDHHRRSNSFVPNTLLSYLEPSSSSTCELVTELLQYFNEDITLNEVEASALYAGIVVDTKNFAVMTGIRTFDAASYLRRSGANTDLVRDLFMMDFDLMMKRSLVLSRAERIDGHIACATVPDDVENAQVLAGQVADILANIEEVQVSFTIYYNGDGYSVSARSGGDINVQLIMEALGGGGHQTVAGGQFRDKTPAEIRDMVVAEIRKQCAKEEKE